MTRQAIYNKVKHHFITLQMPLAVEHDHCRYRTAYGARCAIGIFISDAMYTPDLEAMHLYELPAIPGLYNRGRNIQFLTGLQNAHDMAAFGEHDLLTALQDFAYIHNLTP